MLSRFMRRYEQWAQRNYGLIRGNKTSVDNQWNLIRPLRRINIVIITRDTSNKKKKKRKYKFNAVPIVQSACDDSIARFFLDRSAFD